MTNAHDRLRGNRVYKYKHIIAPLMLIKLKKKFGRGLSRAITLNDNAIDYVHWDDSNELVDRLRLLEASYQIDYAYDNEMLSIIEELREASWHHYKLTHISSKRTSRSTSLASRKCLSINSGYLTGKVTQSATIRIIIIIGANWEITCVTKLCVVQVVQVWSLTQRRVRFAV